MIKRIIVAVVCVPLVFFIMFFAPWWAAWSAVMLTAGIALYEFSRAYGYDKKEALFSAVRAGFICPAALLAGFDNFAAAWSMTAVHILAMLLLVVLAKTVYTPLVKKGAGLSDVNAKSVAASVCNTIAFSFSALPALRSKEFGQFYVLLPFIIAFITDGGAYFVGIFFGKHKAFPNISPKKTVEGCIGGFAAGTAAAVLFGIVLSHLGYGINYIPLIICGVLGAVATEVGDVLFSLFKRVRGVKDYGNILPGHGGMLDRFDSMVTAAPVIWVIITFFPVII